MAPSRPMPKGKCSPPPARQGTTANRVAKSDNKYKPIPRPGASSNSVLAPNARPARARGRPKARGEEIRYKYGPCPKCDTGHRVRALTVTNRTLGTVKFRFICSRRREDGCDYVKPLASDPADDPTAYQWASEGDDDDSGPGRGNDDHLGDDDDEDDNGFRIPVHAKSGPKTKPVPSNPVPKKGNSEKPVPTKPAPAAPKSSGKSKDAPQRRVACPTCFKGYLVKKADPFHPGKSSMVCDSYLDERGNRVPGCGYKLALDDESASSSDDGGPDIGPPVGLGIRTGPTRYPDSRPTPGLGIRPGPRASLPSSGITAGRTNIPGPSSNVGPDIPASRGFNTGQGYNARPGFGQNRDTGLRPSQSIFGPFDRDPEPDHSPGPTFPSGSGLVPTWPPKHGPGPNPSSSIFGPAARRPRSVSPEPGLGIFQEPFVRPEPSPSPDPDQSDLDKNIAPATEFNPKRTAKKQNNNNYQKSDTAYKKPDRDAMTTYQQRATAPTPPRPAAVMVTEEKKKKKIVVDLTGDDDDMLYRDSSGNSVMRMPDFLLRAGAAPRPAISAAPSSTARIVSNPSPAILAASAGTVGARPPPRNPITIRDSDDEASRPTSSSAVARGGRAGRPPAGTKRALPAAQGPGDKNKKMKYSHDDEFYDEELGSEEERELMEMADRAVAQFRRPQPQQQQQQEQQQQQRAGVRRAAGNNTSSSNNTNSSSNIGPARFGRRH